MTTIKGRDIRVGRDTHDSCRVLIKYVIMAFSRLMKALFKIEYFDVYVSMSSSDDGNSRFNQYC